MHKNKLIKVSRSDLLPLEIKWPRDRPQEKRLCTFSGVSKSADGLMLLVVHGQLRANTAIAMGVPGA